MFEIMSLMLMFSENVTTCAWIGCRGYWSRFRNLNGMLVLCISCTHVYVNPDVHMR